MESAHIGLSNRWEDILVAEGIDESVLDGKQHPCPICGGKDRFRFDDKGEGMWFCNHCGPGDGFKMLMMKFGLTFVQAKDAVNKHTDLVVTRHPRSQLTDAKKRELMNKAWDLSLPVSTGLTEYLLKRGIPDHLHFNPSIRWHPNLYCSDGSIQSPAILIKCYRWGVDGKPEPVTIQRHWVALNTKMMMPSPIKLDGIFCPIGGRPTQGVMGICEGYITALSVMAAQPKEVIGMVPVWAAMSSDQMMKFVPPTNIHTLLIYADVDKSFTGQAAAYALAKKLRNQRPEIEVTVCYPTYKQGVDFDFNDMLQGKKP